MRKKTLVVFLVLALVAFTTGCPTSTIHAAAKASAGIAKGLDTVQDENEKLFNAQKIDKEEAVAIAGAIKAGTLANDQFVNCIKAAKTSGSATGCVQSLSTSLNGISAEVLHVKNKDSQAALQLAVQSLNSVLAAIQALTK